MPKMTPGADAAAAGVIAGYEIRRLLGRGGMGDVYLAFDPRLERPVALKVLTTRLVGDEESRARPVQESRLAASLDHPNVVPIYDAGECRPAGATMPYGAPSTGWLFRARIQQPFDESASQPDATASTNGRQ